MPAPHCRPNLVDDGAAAASPLLPLRTSAAARSAGEPAAAPSRHHPRRQSPPRALARHQRAARSLRPRRRQARRRARLVHRAGDPDGHAVGILDREFSPPGAELCGLLGAIEAKLNALARDPAIHRRRVRLRAIGRLDMLEGPVRDAIAAAERATAGYDGIELNYRHRLWRPAGDRRCGAEPVGLHGSAGRDPRRGGPRRHPGGDRRPSLHRRPARPRPDHPHLGRDPPLRLPAVAERAQRILFHRRAWPAMRKIDFLRAIRAYQQRARRFGC